MITLDSNSIRNFLTLRYDPSKKSPIRPLNSEDFFPKNTNKIELKIKEKIECNLLREHQNKKFQNISISLSGGIDSGLTLAMIRTTLPEVKINCIGMGFGNKDDEVNRARELARIYDCDFTEIIKENILNDLPKLVKIVQEPKWNLYNFYALELGKKNSSIFFTGDGGDELFGGYTFRLEKFLANLKKGFSWKDKTKLYLNCHERDWVPDQEDMFGKKIDFSWEKIYDIFKPYFDNGLSEIDQVFLSDFNGKLLYDWTTTNLAYENYFKIKIKSIFLSDEIIKFATHIPWEKKFDPTTRLGKIPLRNILSNYKGFLNEKMLKKGFGTDLSELWNKNAKDIVNKYVNLDSEIIKQGIIGLNWLNKTKEKLNSGKPDLRYVNKMMSLLSLEIWYKIFISKSMNCEEKL
jgi:asparagine synthase (glutamine-hydrolysing)